jgi:hypothetical protein
VPTAAGASPRSSPGPSSPRPSLLVLGFAAVAGLLSASPLSPYEKPWSIDGDRETARRGALAVVPEVVPVRVPADLVSEVAERRQVEVLDPDERDPRRIADGVVAVVVDETDYPDLDPAERHALRRAIEAEGMVQIYRLESMVAFVRIVDDGRLIESRLPDPPS